MRLRAKLLRILRTITIALISFVLLLFAFVQGEQHLLRHRAASLLADFKTLKLGQSPWPEVQSFSDRWKHWRHSTSPCDATYCSYDIVIEDTVSLHSPNLFERQTSWLNKSHLQWVLDRLGYRMGRIYATVTFVNGVLLSDRIEMLVIEPHSATDGEYAVDMSVRAQPNLAAEKLTKGNYEVQMAAHPDYFVGRPGGCEGCFVGWIHFVPTLSDAEHTRMMNFQLDCFTRWKRCTRPEDLLPMVALYHLYDHTRAEELTPETPACSESPYVLGRDAYWTLVLDTLAVKPHKFDEKAKLNGYDYKAEDVKVSWISVLQGDLGAYGPYFYSLTPQVEAIDTFMPFPGMQDGDVIELPEHLAPGKRYIVFWNAKSVDADGALDRCGFVLDTPEDRAEVLAGMTQNLKFQSPKLNLGGE